MTKFENVIQNSVAQAVALFNKIEKQHALPGNVVFVSYKSNADLWRFRTDMKSLPVAVHTEILSRMTHILELRGVSVITKQMEPKLYVKWLRGREDSEVERSAWAGEQWERSAKGV